MAMKRKKILSVTRDLVLLSFLQTELKGEVYEFINTEHTDNHLKEILDVENPELVIIDVVMPTLDGIGTCLQVRQWTQSPIMMLSTWNTGDNTVRGLNLGADNYLTEPFGSGELKKRIEENLNR
jgi:DNA-binding response OmpR family regulator